MKYLPLFHHFKAIYQFPKHIICLVKIVANASLKCVLLLLVQPLSPHLFMSNTVKLMFCIINFSSCSVDRVLSTTLYDEVCQLIRFVLPIKLTTTI
jgi:hypothetical protein